MAGKTKPRAVWCALALVLAIAAGPWLGYHLGGRAAMLLFPPAPGSSPCGLGSLAVALLGAVLCGAPLGLLVSVGAVWWGCFRRGPR